MIINRFTNLFLFLTFNFFTSQVKHINKFEVNLNDKVKIKQVFRIPVFRQVELVDFYPNSLGNCMPLRLTTCLSKHGIILPKSGLTAKSYQFVN